MRIGIITGSGTYALPELDASAPTDVETPFGPARVTEGRFAGVDVLPSDTVDPGTGDQRSNLTVIGHSYGSTTAAHAAHDHGLDADAPQRQISLTEIAALGRVQPHVAMKNGLLERDDAVANPSYRFQEL